jgi:hypothetical protein
VLVSLVVLEPAARGFECELTPYKSHCALSAPSLLLAPSPPQSFRRA